VATGYSFSRKTISDGIIKKKVDATIAFLWENFSAFCFDGLNSIILKPGALKG
jgi:hypothetical protein